MKEIEMKRVAVDKVVVAENFRKLMDKNGLKELVENVKQMGVIEPIILRKEKGDLILVAGARRLAAAQENKHKDIPARIIEATEEEAEMVQAVENLHRENLNPMDEAEQFQKLLRQKSAKELAAAVNKTVKYIHRSLALLDLKDDAKKLIRTGKMLPAHGHLLLKVPEKQLEATMKYLVGQLDYYGNQYPVTQFQTYVDGIVGTDLSTAQFDTKACQACAHYGKNQSMLFDNAQEGLCNNKVCFANKTAEYLKSLADAAAQRGFKGLKYLGAKNPKYSYETSTRNVGKGMVIEERWATDRVLALRKSNPEKFGYIIDTSKENKPTLVVLNREDVMPKGKTQDATKVDWDREHFIGDHVRNVVNKAVKLFDLSKGGLAQTMLAEMVATSVSDDEIKFIHGKVLDAKGLAKLQTWELVKLLWLDRENTAADRAKAMKTQFPKLEAEMAEAKKLAEAAWPAEKAKRDEAAKAAAEKAKADGAKNKTKPVDVEEEDDEEDEETKND